LNAAWTRSHDQLALITPGDAMSALAGLAVADIC